KPSRSKSTRRAAPGPKRPTTCYGAAVANGARSRNPRSIRLMSRPVIVTPSILSADFGRLAEEVRAVTAAGADWIHVDVMDGRFVPPITIGPLVVAAIRRATHLPLDVHLMIETPEKQVAEFVRAGAHGVTVHVEA